MEQRTRPLNENYRSLDNKKKRNEQLWDRKWLKRKYRQHNSNYLLVASNFFTTMSPKIGASSQKICARSDANPSRAMNDNRVYSSSGIKPNKKCNSNPAAKKLKRNNCHHDSVCGIFDLLFSPSNIYNMRKSARKIPVCI